MVAIFVGPVEGANDLRADCAPVRADGGRETHFRSAARRSPENIVIFDPSPSKHLRFSALDDLDLRLLNFALDQDMPVLAICRGMQLLNVARGGQLLQDLTGHRAERREGRWLPQTHTIFLTPGAKAAAVIGSAGFFRVNSLHHQGLKEAQRSPRLMTTAYSVEDGLVEALESPDHSWVIGFQCHPERQDEVPRSFANLFAAFLDRAEMYQQKAEAAAP